MLNARPHPTAQKENLLIDSPKSAPAGPAFRRIQSLFMPFLVAATLAPMIAQAETPEEKGLAIAVEMDRRNQGFVDTTSNMKMILRNRAGKESLRQMRAMTLEVQGDGDKSLTIFDEPKDVKGTASLTFSHSTTADEQWLYAFEDISSQEVDKYTYKFLREEDLNGRKTFVVESIPTYENSGYTRLINWIDQQEYYPVKTEFYDRKSSLLKTLEQRNHQQYLGKYWRASEMFMQNEQTGKSTTLMWEDYQFQTGLSDSDFNSKALKRFR